MSWKSLLVFADASDAGLARVRLALDLARASEGHLEVRHLYEVWQPPIGVGVLSVLEAHAELLAMARAEGEKALKAIEALHTPGADFSVYAQPNEHVPIAEAAAIASRRSELVVLGQPEQDGIDSEIAEGVLFGGGAPALVLPRWAVPHAWGKRVLIAWKSSPQAARAVRASLPILAKASSIRIVVVDPHGEEGGEGEEAIQRLAAAIARHGAKIEAPVLMKSSLGEVAQAIESETEEFNADLLVLGAYAHSRATEWVFGGVTRHMLKNARVPLFMAH